MLILWLEFIACAGVIVFCGTKLSRYGDVIAEKAGLGRAWIGLILMASITSLPELINGISSVAFAGVPDIAVGDLMGSCIFNISIIALMDVLHGPKPIFHTVEHGHILSAGFGIILIGTASAFTMLGERVPAIGYIGLYTPLLILIYFIGIRSVYFFEKRKIREFVGEIAEAAKYEDITLKKAAANYAINAFFIVAAATFLPFIGDRLASATGLGRSFVGTFFIGIATSLPELVVSIASLKIGATDMAIANLFGSNMFNMFILAIDDIFYQKGSILSDVNITHSLTGLIAMVMTGISIVALTYRIEKKPFLRLGWDAIALLTAYAINVALLYYTK